MRRIRPELRGHGQRELVVSETRMSFACFLIDCFTGYVFTEQERVEGILVHVILWNLPKDWLYHRAF